MEAPKLKLTVEKGAKDVEGKTREFKPPRSTKIRIGRVVKGNNFTIKDEGISSNHLLIEFNNTTSKWVLSDLGSSNGTCLNTVQLDAHTQHVLQNGDVVKIGEMTSMKITIDTGEEEDQKLKGKQTKGAKKTAKNAAAAVSDDGKEVEEVAIEEEEEEKLKGKQPRGAKKTAATVSASTSVAAADEVKEVEEVNLDGGPRQLRRNARRHAAAVLVVENVVEKVKNQGRRGRPRKANVQAESVSVGVTGMDIDAKDEASNIGVGEASKSVEVLGEERVSVKKEPCDDAVPSTSEKSPQLEKLTRLKFEKMTLGEYFDYLEVYLPQQIHEETDVIIKGMIDKAEKTKKYMSSSKN